MHLRRMVTGGRGHDVYPGSGPLDGGNTIDLDGMIITRVDLPRDRRG